MMKTACGLFLCALLTLSIFPKSASAALIRFSERS